MSALTINTVTGEVERPILDLAYSHFRHVVGGIEVFGTWFGEENEQCLVLLPANRLGLDGLNPVIIPLSSVWKYHEANFDMPFIRHEFLPAACAMLRLNPHSKSDRMAILRAIATHYDDLMRIPPRPQDGRRVVADAISVNSETGETTSAEISDHV